jgi:hypothetical protein
MALTVPTQLLMLTESAALGAAAAAAAGFVSGGAPCPAPLAERVRAAGYAFREGYGLTECGPNCFAISDERRAAAGQRRLAGAPPGDAAGGRTTGEADPARASCCSAARSSSPATCATPERTAEALTPTAGSAPATWPAATPTARTPSAAGARRCTSPAARTSSPARWRPALADCRGAEAVVVGVPDARWGEVGRAFVVPRPGAPHRGRGAAHAAPAWPATRCRAPSSSPRSRAWAPASPTAAPSPRWSPSRDATAVQLAKGSTLRSTLAFLGEAAGRRRWPPSSRAWPRRSAPDGGRRAHRRGAAGAPARALGRGGGRGRRRAPGLAERSGAFAIEESGVQLYGGILLKKSPRTSSPSASRSSASSTTPATWRWCRSRRPRGAAAGGLRPGARLLLPAAERGAAALGAACGRRWRRRCGTCAARGRGTRSASGSCGGVGRETPGTESGD